MWLHLFLVFHPAMRGARDVYFFSIEKEDFIFMARCKRVLTPAVSRVVTPAAAIANLELEEAELLNRLRSTQEKQRLAYRSFPPKKKVATGFLFAACHDLCGFSNVSGG